MHDVHGVIDRLAFAHENRTLPVRPTANRDGGVFCRDTGIEGDNGVEAQRFVEGMLELSARLEALEGDVAGVGVGAKLGEDGGAEAVVDGGVSDEQVEGPAEQGGGGVAAGEEDVEDLRAEFDGIARLRRQRFEEDVFLPPALFLVFVLQVRVQGQAHEVVGELVRLLAGEAKSGRVIEPVLVEQAAAAGEVPLRDVEGVGEGFLVLSHFDAAVGLGFGGEVGDLRPDALAHEELGGGVESQAEEENLQVYGCGPSILLDDEGSHHVRHVLFFELEIRDLISNERGSDHRSRVLPRLAVLREDAAAEQRHESVASVRTEAELVELGGKYGLDVLRVGGEVTTGANYVELERVCSHCPECLNQKVWKVLGRVRADDISQSIQAKRPIVLLLWRRLAAPPLGFDGMITAGEGTGNDFKENESYASTKRDHNVGMHVEDNRFLSSNPETAYSKKVAAGLVVVKKGQAARGV